MENGNYLVRVAAAAGSKYRLIVNNGGMKLWDVDGQKFIQPVNASSIGSVYIVEGKLKAIRSKWDLHYYVGGKLKETIVRNVDFSVIEWTRKNCSTTHKEGMMIPVKHIE